MLSAVRSSVCVRRAEENESLCCGCLYWLPQWVITKLCWSCFALRDIWGVFKSRQLFFLFSCLQKVAEATTVDTICSYCTLRWWTIFALCWRCWLNRFWSFHWTGCQFFRESDKSVAACNPLATDRLAPLCKWHFCTCTMFFFWGGKMNRCGGEKLNIL